MNSNQTDKIRPNSWIASVPMYQPGKPIEETARELGFTDIAEIVKVASNENEFGPAPSAIKAMKDNAELMHRYPDGGCFYLKERLSKHLEVTPEHLILGNGSNELIEFLGHCYLNSDTNLVMSEYAFVVYRLTAALFQSQAIVVPAKDYGHDLEKMLEAITPETRMVAICNPNNPTGTLLSSDEINHFLDRLPSHVLAVFDEAYIEFVDKSLQSDLISRIKAGAKNILLLRTFSKAYGLAGLRVGYAVAHPELIELLNHVRQPFNVNAMAQAAAIAALDDQDFIQMLKEANRSGLEFFYQNIPTGIEYIPSSANFIMVKTGDATKHFIELQKKKIIIRPMAGYGLPEWIRITIGTEEQNRRVLAALAELS